MKKIVVAEDSFKGCMSSARVAKAVGDGIRQALPDALVLEVAVTLLALRPNS